MPGREFSQEEYRYGFNGMEKDDELAGAGNSYTTEWRQLDTRIGRWLSTDPVVHSQFSPFSSFDNNPIYYIDPKGSNAWKPTKDGGWEAEKGDGAWTLSEDAETSYEEAKESMENQGFGIVKRNGKDVSNVKIGDVVYLNQPAQTEPFVQKYDDGILSIEDLFSSSQTATSSNRNVKTLTFIPEIDLGFKFQAGAAYEGKGIGGFDLNAGGVNLLGVFGNDFYGAGVNKSGESNTREVSTGASGNLGGFGGGWENVYNKGLNGSLLKETEFYQGPLNLYTQTTRDYKDSIEIKQFGWSIGVKMGFMLVPTAGIDVILSSDTLPLRK
jgi:RHS repeat-associated protein